MTRENVLAGTQQFKLSLMLLNFLSRYAVVLIHQKWNIEERWIIVYKEIYLVQQPLKLFMCYHLCKPIKLSIKINITKSQLNSKTFILFFISKILRSQ